MNNISQENLWTRSIFSMDDIEIPIKKTENVRLDINIDDFIFNDFVLSNCKKKEKTLVIKNEKRNYQINKRKQGLY